MRVLDKTSAERRRKKIFGALVSTYISTGVPVSSSRVLARSRLDVSPATVRNVIAELDKLGFTVQPHTSSGRVPTQKGLRAFVESLVLDDSPAREFWSKMEADNDVFGDQETSIGALLEKCCALLSDALGEASVVLSPGFVNDFIREIKLVDVGLGRTLAVVISGLGTVTSTTIQVGRKLSYFNFKRIEQYLNARLRGPDFRGAFSEDYLNETERSTAERLYGEVVLKYLISGSGGGKRQLYIQGFSNLFEKKEMHNPEAACSAVKFFEDKSRLIKLLTSCQKKDAVTVLIGDEMQPPAGCSADLAIVAAPYKLNAICAGALGVIGPMRMKYSGIVPFVEHAALFLSRRLSEVHGRARIAFDQGRPFMVVVRPRR